jgi:BirA family transcriptional regulator, biotin operon repressor / biotin---[acetyl-CoA-carboxylase] ligase
VKHDIRVYPTLGSTNNEALRLAAAGENGPLWVLALEQTAGRGRRGNSWLGASGNLFLSGLHTLAMPAHQAAGISFVAALALADAFGLWVDPARVRLKWPNDVEIDGAKCSGILIESSYRADDHTCIVTGIGVNLVTAPTVAGRDTACLAAAIDPHRAASAGPLQAVPFAYALANAFTRRLAAWQTKGFAAIRADWLTRARGIGEAVTVRLPDREVSGVFATLSVDGALQLLVADDTIVDIYAGDVFFGTV